MIILIIFVLVVKYNNIATVLNSIEFISTAATLLSKSLSETVQNLITIYGNNGSIQSNYSRSEIRATSDLIRL